MKKTATGTTDFSLYIERRKKLLQIIQDAYPTCTSESVIVLFAGFEHERIRFRQESSFYYLTGIEEPGVVLTMQLDGSSQLWIPNCITNRAQWMDMPVAFDQANAKQFGVDTVGFLGSSCQGYQFHPFFPVSEYEHLVNYFKKCISAQGSILTLAPDDASSYSDQRLILERMHRFIGNFEKNVVDISSLVHALRRKKDMHEIELIYKAIDITSMAQEAAAQAIKPGASEAEVYASIHYIFTGSSAQEAFPSIVAGGRNGTILHYTRNSDVLNAGDLVVVDIGAEHNYYAADITRTYPVSGTFNKRQKELYSIVLDTQQHIADLARPGMWLSNKNNPDKSLHHLALAFLKERGYDKYFVHGIGHFLGLDVHDVGDRSQPLQVGDVFTIEPGIYIPEEKIGIRIEDNYWVVEDGVVCLSEQLPKKIEQIEEMVRESLIKDEKDNESFSEEDDDLDLAH